MDFAQVLELISPELFILVAVMYVIGVFLKRSQSFDDRMIPLVIGGIAIVLTILYIGVMEGFTQQGIMAGFLQGILIAGVTVYFNELKKQSQRED
jgi:1,4-dihydroxy-2-naphthoate octaprenyltransferase